VEATNQAMPAQAQTSSPMPTSAESVSASPSGMSQPQASQAYQVQAQAPQMPTYQAPVQAQQASAPQGNPWQEAFQVLSASLNTSSPSQTQVPYSAYQTPTPQASQQASWASIPQAVSAPTAQPTYSPQALTQAYSTAQAPMQAPMQMQPQQQEAVSDAYLSQISDESLEVLEHFGAEAPVLLNQYACAVEDALIEQVQSVQAQSLLLEAAGEERAAMNLMLTDPDVLADYVNDFYGPNGPYPTPTPEEAHQMNQIAAREQFEAEIRAQEMNNVPQNFQRPEMEMPTPGRQVNQSNDFWGSFGQMMDNNPENAWRYLAQAPQGALQAKMLVQEG
jgi:hypothetical protein